MTSPLQQVGPTRLWDPPIVKGEGEVIYIGCIKYQLLKEGGRHYQAIV